MARRRWLIEGSRDDDWEVIGSIDATSPEEAAFAAGGWADAKGHKLKASPWDQASTKDREAAEYEDDMRFRQWQAYGGRGTVEYAAAHGEPALTAARFHAMNRYVRRRPHAWLGWAVLGGIALFILLRCVG
jgi:NADPH-dependent glutamate synthase beta subunit-like oxidoreductase